MPILVLALFIGLPLIEVWLLVEVGGRVGAWWTVALCVATAVAGAAVVRRQGRSTLLRVRTTLRQGRMPLGDLFTGACILAAGVMLLVPGFFSDATGFLLLVPFCRGLLGLVLGRFIHIAATQSRAGGRTIEGEWESVDDRPNGQLNRTDPGG